MHAIQRGTMVVSFNELRGKEKRNINIGSFVRTVWTQAEKKSVYEKGHLGVKKPEKTK